ncbi:MAG: cyclophilin-like fold protein [Erysipelotrichaceae bacterium]|nr:cyclophilin-like fold protein [Erysipelotrichaceae bacterium]
MKRVFCLMLGILVMSGCAVEEPALQTAAPEKQTEEKENEKMLNMMIGDTAVEVVWEDNGSVSALTELAAESPLSIQMSMYGGFEQVGPIGTSLPRNDVQTVTDFGDIVLYSGDQIVVFYGSNSWAYTRLGHIADKTQAEMTELLGSGDVVITLKAE